MNDENAKDLARAIHALTESLSMSFKIQAETYKILAQIHPEYKDGLLAAQQGVLQCASNLVKHLPKLPVD